jgi:hypothetical protein
MAETAGKEDKQGRSIISDANNDNSNSWDHINCTVAGSSRGESRNIQNTVKATAETQCIESLLLLHCNAALRKWENAGTTTAASETTGTSRP